MDEPESLRRVKPTRHHRPLRDREVAGSNPVAPTIQSFNRFFFVPCSSESSAVKSIRHFIVTHPVSLDDAPEMYRACHARRLHQSGDETG
jgi:hypothetical protein